MINSILDEIPRLKSSEIIECTEINPDMEFEYIQIEDLEYIKVHNFLKNPDKMVDFLKKFPCEDRSKSLESDEGEKLLTCSKAPGFQQPIPALYFKNNLTPVFFNFLEYHHMVKYDIRRCKWAYYTNCCYPKMKAYSKNYYPHVDPFTYAFNLFLSDAEYSSTDFFKLKVDEDTYVYNVSQLSRHKEAYDADIDRRQNKNLKEKFSVWRIFEGDEHYIKYHSVPATFNSVTIYRGDKYHTLAYDAEKAETVRYSLVSALT